MKRIKTCLVLLLSIVLIAVSYLHCMAQPITPKESIPSDISSDVRRQIEGLYSTDPLERATAASNLREMGNKAISAVPYLLEIINDSTPLTSYLKYSSGKVITSSPTSPGHEAAVALGRIKDPRSVEPLINKLKSTKCDIKRNASIALGYLEDSRSVEPLINVVSDKHCTGAAEKATIALGTIKDVRAVGPLIKALKRGLFKDWIHHSLKKITGQDHGEDWEKWQKWWDQNKDALLKNR